MMPDVYEFYNLGIGDPVPISASERIGIGDMLDKVLHIFRKGTARKRKMTVRELQSLGSRTLGKSSIINRLIGKRPCDRIRYCRYYKRCH